MFLGALQALKRQALEREGAVKKSCEGALTKRTDELEKVKVDFKVRVDEFNAAIKKLESAGGSQVCTEPEPDLSCITPLLDTQFYLRRTAPATHQGTCSALVCGSHFYSRMVSGCL